MSFSFDPRPLAVIAALSGLAACGTTRGVAVDRNTIPPMEQLSPSGQTWAMGAAYARHITLSYAATVAARDCAPIDPTVLERDRGFYNPYMGRHPRNPDEAYVAVNQFITNGTTLCSIIDMPRLNPGESFEVMRYITLQNTDGSPNAPTGGTLILNPAFGATTPEMFWAAAGIAAWLEDTNYWRRSFVCRSQYQITRDATGVENHFYTQPMCVPEEPVRLTLAPDATSAHAAPAVR